MITLYTQWSVGTGRANLPSWLSQANPGDPPVPCPAAVGQEATAGTTSWVSSAAALDAAVRPQLMVAASPERRRSTASAPALRAATSGVSPACSIESSQESDSHTRAHKHITRCLWWTRLPNSKGNHTRTDTQNEGLERTRGAHYLPS